MKFLLFVFMFFSFSSHSVLSDRYKSALESIKRELYDEELFSYDFLESSKDQFKDTSRLSSWLAYKIAAYLSQNAQYCFKGSIYFCKDYVLNRNRYMVEQAAISCQDQYYICFSMLDASIKYCLYAMRHNQSETNKLRIASKIDSILDLIEEIRSSASSTANRKSVFLVEKLDFNKQIFDAYLNCLMEEINEKTDGYRAKRMIGMLR